MKRYPGFTMALFEIHLRDAPFIGHRLPPTPVPSWALFLPAGVILTWIGARWAERKIVQIPLVTTGLASLTTGIVDGLRSVPEKVEEEEEHVPSREEVQARETLEAAKEVSGYDSLGWHELAGPVAGYFADQVTERALENFGDLQLVHAAQDPHLASLVGPSLALDALIDAADGVPVIRSLLPDVQTRRFAARVVWMAKEVIVFTDALLEYGRHHRLEGKGAYQAVPDAHPRLQKLVGTGGAVRLSLLADEWKQSVGETLQKGAEFAEGMAIGLHARRLYLGFDRNNEMISRESEKLFLYNIAFVAARSEEYLARAWTFLTTTNRDRWPAPARFVVNEIQDILVAGKKLVEDA